MINLDNRLLSEVNENELWLLVHLAKRLNKNRICWPSNKVLCKELGWSLNKLQSVKNGLIKKNFLQVIARKNEAGQTPNAYLIKTELVGVYVNLKDVEITDCEPNPPHPKNKQGDPYPKIDEPPTQKLGNEVLIKEVLIKDVSSISEKVITKLNELKSEYGIKGGVRNTSERSKLINSRIKESKVSLEDVFNMIEHRCKDWKGTTFEKYIRVETLFQPKKFMAYIEEAQAQPEKDWTEKRRSTTAYDNNSKTNYIW